MAGLGLLKKDLRKKADKNKAMLLQGFFKTGKGEYGQGDVFLGIVMPSQRVIVKKYVQQISLPEVDNLLKSKYHEERMTALLIFVLKYKKGSEKEKQQIFKLYLKNTKFINNWDLVDVTCRDIIGAHLFNRSRQILYKLAKSKDLWEKRIAIISTAYFIPRQQFDDTLKIATILLKDKHDLIHKAVGWMLREVGKRSRATEQEFLKKHYQQMPRTMLRYAIEHFPEQLRQGYLKGKI